MNYYQYFKYSDNFSILNVPPRFITLDMYYREISIMLPLLRMMKSKEMVSDDLYMEFLYILIHLNENYKNTDKFIRTKIIECAKLLNRKYLNEESNKIIDDKITEIMDYNETHKDSFHIKTLDNHYRTNMEYININSKEE